MDGVSSDYYFLMCITMIDQKNRFVSNFFSLLKLMCFSLQGSARQTPHFKILTGTISESCGIYMNILYNYHAAHSLHTITNSPFIVVA